MADTRLDSQLRRFIDEHINSVALLELLLLLRTTAKQSWSVQQLARELRVEPSWAETQLNILQQQGLVRPDDDDPECFRYNPQNPELEASVTALSQAYLVNRVSVIEHIYSKSHENIRAFADAFQIRREPPRG